MRFKINWRFLLKLAVPTVVALIALHYTHRAQVRRQVGVFLHQANIARDATPLQPEREVAYLKRYLMARPDENDARERLARLLCQTAKSQRELFEGYLVVQDVLRRDPARDELRRYAIDFAMNPDHAMFAEALVDIEDLLAKRPNDGELEGLAARCLVHEKKFKEADERFGDALKHRPDLLDNYPPWAAVRRTMRQQGEKADEVVVQMLKSNPSQFRAHVLVAEYWRAFWPLGQNATAAARLVAVEQKLAPEEKVADAIAKAIAEAEKLAPDELAVFLARATVARFRGYEFVRAIKPEEAKSAFAESHRILKAGLAKHPKEATLYLELAALEEERQERTPVAVIKEGLEAVPGSVSLRRALLDYQIRAGDVVGATESLAALKNEKNGWTATQAELQQGRILILKGEWAEAARTFDYVRKNASDKPELVREANLYAGRCYGQMGLLDQRLAAFSQAVPLDTTDRLWLPAMLGVAEAEAALGRPGAAIQAYTKLKDRGYAGVWVPITRLRLSRALQAPVDEKTNWSEVEEALAAAEKFLPKSVETRILRAELLNAQGKPGEARARLEELCAERPKDELVRIALALQDQRDGKPDAALRSLETAEKEIADSPALRLAKAHLWADTKDPELARKLGALGANTDKFSPDQQRVLIRGLADVASTFASGPLEAQLRDRAAALQPHDVGLQLARFDAALRENDEAKAADVLKEIRRISGDTGAAARFARALLLVWRAQHKSEPTGLNEAATLLDGLARERSGWGRVLLAQGFVHDLRGETQPALEKYQQAFAAGESRPELFRRLLELLRANRRFDEAAAVLQKFPKGTAFDGPALRVAAEVALETKSPAQATDYAERAVPSNSKDPGEYIWQGQIFSAAGEPAKAEVAFRKAVELRPESPDGWLILIQHLARTQRREAAEKLLEEAKEKVAKAERSLFLAQAYAVVAQAEKAKEAFTQARGERPTDPRTLRIEAEFLFRTGQLADAREAFKRVVGLQGASAADKEYARQMIGVCLAADPDYATARRALDELGLVEGDRFRAPNANETPAERRGRIAVLALQRDRASRLEAIRLLEADKDLTPPDQFLLAQLHQSVGNRVQVRVVMSGLVKKNDQAAVYIRFFAAWLLQIGDHRAATEHVRRLNELQPAALSTAELRARLAAAQGDLAGARAIIVPRAEGADAPVLAVARICESIKLTNEAERLYKRVVAEVKEKQPQAPLLLAAFYGRQKRTGEALAICDEVRKAVPTQAVSVGGVAVVALYDTPSPKGADVAHVAAWLGEEVKKATGQAKANFVQLLASVRNLQADYAASMALYRDAMKENETDILAMNNLAYLLSANDRKHDEALELLAKAKKMRGPLPDLIDTEALVQLNNKKPEEARRLLETVVAEAPSGAAYFHLARAELALNRKLEARRAWQQAEELGVKQSDVHPLERPEFTRIPDLVK